MPTQTTDVPHDELRTILAHEDAEESRVQAVRAEYQEKESKLERENAAALQRQVRLLEEEIESALADFDRDERPRILASGEEQLQADVSSLDACVKKHAAAVVSDLTKHLISRENALV